MHVPGFADNGERNRHGPTLYQSGLPRTRRLELVSAKPLRSGAVAMHYRRAR
jgi:hypothetical protein